MFYGLKEVFIMFKRFKKKGWYVKKATAILLVLLMALNVLSACGGGGSDNNADTYGTGTYTTEETADGWILVKNEGGVDLGYSADSGVTLIEDNGYAFKDLNRNGELDVYEDWRLDDNTRAENLAGQLDTDTIFGLMDHLSIGSIQEDGSDAASFYDLSFKESISEGGRSVLTFATATPVSTQATWNNNAQAYAESLDYGIPVNISSNPQEYTVSNLALAATFDSDKASEIAQTESKLYRSVGISTLLGPQIDLATEPRWSRNGGTYGEDPALSRDITNAYISGLQSTYDESGADLGWGVDSVIGMMKHYPGDGPGEGGRESHNAYGKFNVYPGKAFETNLIPFIDGALNLDSSTGESAAVMTSYSIAYTEDKSLGDLVGTSFSEYKIRNVLREGYSYDGLVVTDWGVIYNVGEGYTSTPWGVEDLSLAERVYLIIVAGVDQVGGAEWADFGPAIQEAYAMYVDEYGEEAAVERFQESARRILLTFFESGIFDNAYVSVDDATTLIESGELATLDSETELASIVMLKNDGNVIQPAGSSGEKPTVYIPMKYSAGGFGPTGPTPSGWVLPVDADKAAEYFNVVTDKVAETLTGAPDEQGNSTESPNDIVRASSAELTECDYALVFVENPDTGVGYNAESETYIPVSLQYGEYTANSAAVRKESIAGDKTEVEVETVYGAVKQEGQENRSYYGQSTMASNYGDLESILYASENMPADAAVIVCVNDTDSAMIFSEFENKVDSILIGFGTSNNAFFDIVAGKTEPSGLLPVQMPKDMETVEAQNEDVPRDMECYVDSAGNTYDFAFGLNWSGVIKDDRVAKYSVPALTEPGNKEK
jgi:beta-glucosidase